LSVEGVAWVVAWGIPVVERVEGVSETAEGAALVFLQGMPVAERVAADSCCSP
jgi:hypothetical protein